MAAEALEELARGGDLQPRARSLRMWTRLIAKLMALIGLYALILAGLSMRFSGQQNSKDFNLTLGELGIVTVAFIALAAFLVTRRPKQPLE